MPTILELFKNSDLDRNIDTNPDTFLEQEVRGLRIKSAVELNNPLLYGNEAIRIVNRSTKDIEDMKKAKAEDKGEGPTGDGGLIGKGLSKLGVEGGIGGLRDKVNSKLGVPTTIIPTSYDNKLGKVDIKQYPETLAKIKSDAAGSFVGNLLSGGTPKTMLQQAAGNALKEAKDLVRDTLFKNSSAIKDKFSKDGKEGEAKKLAPVDYDRGDSRYSTQRKEVFEAGSFSTTIDAYSNISDPAKYLKDNLKVGSGYEAAGLSAKDSGVPYYKDNSKKVEAISERDEKFRDSKSKLLDKGWKTKEDAINQSGLHDGKLKLGQKSIDDVDFIPLSIKAIGGKAVNFRATVTGVNENVSPSWDSAKFVGNPFNYYTYSGVERSVSFNFTVYPLNLRELINNWNKIEYLTSLCYPLAYVGSPGYVQAPFTFLTLGDLYKKKPSFIESLTYTIPDNGTWEIGIDEKEYKGEEEFFKKLGNNSIPKKSKGYRLPHYIEVAIGFKFVEHRGNSGKTNLYSFNSIT